MIDQPLTRRECRQLERVAAKAQRQQQWATVDAVCPRCRVLGHM